MSDGFDIDTIFCAAIEIESADERHAWLNQACGDNASLRRQVDRLVAAHFRGGSIIDSPAMAIDATYAEPRSESPGTQIGPYKLLQVIGEGGMGVVYMAEQSEPVKRKVALKLIKPGMDSRQVIARFEAERQALSMMDHVNIARVLDAGTTGDGSRPYFVMELIHGVPITKYCDDNHLTPRQRLELFVPVCQAIQHAHQKGIIHRDIKPSNVMITLYDGRPVPKVIDFGVAKATEQKLTERTLFTQYGTMVGTLEYMSPEQAEMSALGVDTRSDIYSLGVMLYELLTGSTPLSRKQMKEAAYAEILRLIKEEEPPRPSTRLSESGAELVSISALRHTEPAKLTKLVRGELDWIVMKTLEKDRNRRYWTAKEFAEDVQSFLNDAPVRASPPSRTYRLRKYVRRNKVRLAITSLVSLLFLLFGCSAGWIYYDRSNRLQKTSEHVNRLLTDSSELFLKGKQSEALAAAREAQAVHEHGGGSDEMRRLVQCWLDDLEMTGRLDEARMKGSEINRDSRFSFEATAAAYAKAFREYGIDVEIMDIAETAHLIRQHDIREPLTIALDHWASLPVVDTPLKQRLTQIANAADADLWRKRLRTVVETGGPELKSLSRSSDVLSQPSSTLILLATALNKHGEKPSAIDLMRQAQRRYPDDFWINLRLGNLLFVDSAETRYDDAIRYLTVAVALRPDSAGAMMQLGLVLSKNGQSAEAIANYQEALRLDPDYIDALVNYGLHLFTVTKDYEEAIVKFTRVIELEPKYHWGWSGRAGANSKLGRHELVISDLTQLLTYHPGKWNIWSARGDSHLALGQHQNAVADFTKAIELKADFQPAWRGRGKAFSALNQAENAARDFRQLEMLIQASATNN
jgi:serine/threonine protein kinase/Flp pilus assembly protein TadD